MGTPGVEGCDAATAGRESVVVAVSIFSRGLERGSVGVITGAASTHSFGVVSISA